MPFDIASNQVLANPVGSYLQGRALRAAEDDRTQRSALMRSQETRAQEDHAVNMEQAKVTLGAAKAKQVYAMTEQALATPEGQRKQFVQEHMGELAQEMQKSGHDFESFDEATVTQMLQGIHAHAAGELGITPQQEAPKAKYIDAGDKMVAVDDAGRPIKNLPPIMKAASPESVLSAKTSRENTLTNAAVDREKIAGAKLSADDQERVASAIANYQQAPFGSFALGKPANQAIMARVMELNPNYNTNEYGARSKAFKDFATGKNGNMIRSFNVALAHLDTLGQLSDALDNGNIQLVNKVSQAFSQQTGSEAPNNFDSAKKIVGDEIVKAIVGSGGGVADRDEIARTMSKVNSPAQLKGVIKTYQTLMGGQLGGLRLQFEQTTGRKDFDTLLSTEAKQYVKDHPASGGGKDNDPLGIR